VTARKEKLMKRLFVEEEGQTLIEYGLLTALISVVAIAILTVLGRKTRDVYVTVNDSMTTAKS
jgi:pilus assembly protein Flp/PilA